MPQKVFQGCSFKVTYTQEAEGPHLTREDDHYEEHFIITALFRGEGICFVEGNSYSLAPSELVLVRSDELRCCRFSPQGPHERLSLYFSPAILSPFWEYDLSLLEVFRNHPPGIGNKANLREGKRKAVWDVLEDIRNSMREIPEVSDNLQQVEMHLLLLRLLLRLYQAKEQDSKSWGGYNNDSIIRNICQYIRENLNARLTYRHLQEHCHVSRYQLGEVFRRSTGMTLTEYVLQKRLIRVSELVRSGAGIEQAALNAGFHNYSHFYKEFIKHKGMPPRQYFSRKRGF